MRQFLRHPKILALLIVASFAVTSCGPNESDTEELTAIDVAGIWKSNKGGQIVITEGGSVSFSNITQDPYCVPEKLRNAVPRASGSGKWTFETVPDERPGVKIEFNTGMEKPPYCVLYSSWVGKRPYSEMYLHQDDGMSERYRRDPAAH